MNTSQDDQDITRPGLIKSITAGFNSITNNIYLILFPLALDLLLWFAPHIRLKEITQPLINELLKPQPEIHTPDMIELIDTSRELWLAAMERVNLVNAIRTYPVGIPSLFHVEGTLTNPLGNPLFFEVNSFGMALGLWLVFCILGIIAGSIFFSEIARVNSFQRERFSIKRIMWFSGQIFALTITLLIFIFIITIPISLILSLVTIINAVFGQLAIFLFGLLVIWLALPLIFSPHGIFLNRNTFFQSIQNSTRLVRLTFPSTGLFILTLIFLSQGLDILWRIPSESSWFLLIGITGHAFISTSVVSASFIFYRDGIKWMVEKVFPHIGDPEKNSFSSMDRKI